MDDARTCGVCLEEGLEEIGEIEGCSHVFCFACISKWAAEGENRCPACRASFNTIARKRLSPDGGHEEEGEGPPRKRLRGQILETVHVEDKQQQYRPEELLHLDLDNLRCEVCGTGEDEHELMLCDGCDRGFHLNCVGLSSLPEEEWFCEDCEDARVILAEAGRRQRRAARAGRAGQGQQQGRARRGRGAAGGSGAGGSRSRAGRQAGAGAAAGAGARSGGGSSSRRAGRGAVPALSPGDPELEDDDEEEWVDFGSDSGGSSGGSEGGRADSAIVIDDSEEEDGRAAPRASGRSSRRAQAQEEEEEEEGENSEDETLQARGRRRRQSRRATARPSRQRQVGSRRRRAPAAGSAAVAGMRAADDVASSMAAAMAGLTSSGVRSPPASSSGRLRRPAGVPGRSPRFAADVRAQQAAARATAAASGGVFVLGGSAPGAGAGGAGSRAAPRDQRAVDALRSEWARMRAGQVDFGEVGARGAAGRRRRPAASLSGGTRSGSPGGVRAEGAAEGDLDPLDEAWNALERAQRLGGGSSSASSSRARAVLAMQRQHARGGGTGRRSSPPPRRDASPLGQRAAAPVSAAQAARNVLTRTVVQAREQRERMHRHRQQAEPSGSGGEASAGPSSSQQRQPPNQFLRFASSARPRPQVWQPDLTGGSQAPRGTGVSQPVSGNAFARLAGGAASAAAGAASQPQPASFSGPPAARVAPGTLDLQPSTSRPGASASGATSASSRLPFPGLGPRQGMLSLQRVAAAPSTASELRAQSGGAAESSGRGASGGAACAHGAGCQGRFCSGRDHNGAGVRPEYREASGSEQQHRLQGPSGRGSDARALTWEDGAAAPSWARQQSLGQRGAGSSQQQPEQRSGQPAPCPPGTAAADTSQQQRQPASEQAGVADIDAAHRRPPDNVLVLDSVLNSPMARNPRSAPAAPVGVSGLGPVPGPEEGHWSGFAPAMPSLLPPPPQLPSPPLPQQPPGAGLNSVPPHVPGGLGHWPAGGRHGSCSQPPFAATAPLPPVPVPDAPPVPLPAHPPPLGPPVACAATPSPAPAPAPAAVPTPCSVVLGTPYSDAPFSQHQNARVPPWRVAHGGSMGGRATTAAAGGDGQGFVSQPVSTGTLEAMHAAYLQEVDGGVCAQAPSAAVERSGAGYPQQQQQPGVGNAAEGHVAQHPHPQQQQQQQQQRSLSSSGTPGLGSDMQSPPSVSRHERGGRHGTRHARAEGRERGEPRARGEHRSGGSKAGRSAAASGQQAPPGGGGSPPNIKVQCFEAVKVVLKPLLERRCLNEQQYKVVARAAAQGLRGGLSRGELSELDLQVSTVAAREAVREAMQEAGLELPSDNDDVLSISL